MVAKGLQKETDGLHVFMNGLLVGILKRARNDTLWFAYDTKWLSRELSIPISRRFPLRSEPYSGKIVTNYFDNLLPEDHQVRERIAARMRAEGVRPYDLLAAIGHDCVGALQFYQQGKKPEPTSRVSGKPISARQIAQLLRNLRINPLGVTADRDFRISLAGVQAKTALLNQDGAWFLPEGSTPSTHIQARHWADS